MSFWHIYICASYQKWSFRRFTYGNLVTTSPSSRKFNLQILKKYTNLAGRQQFLQSTHQLIQSVGATGGVVVVGLVGVVRPPVGGAATPLGESLGAQGHFQAAFNLPALLIPSCASSQWNWKVIFDIIQKRQNWEWYLNNVNNKL